MKDQNNSQNRNFDIASFKRATEGMISKNDESYGDYDYLSYRRTARTTLKDYKPEEIEQIINSGSLQEQRALSKIFPYSRRTRRLQDWILLYPRHE